MKSDRWFCLLLICFLASLTLMLIELRSQRLRIEEIEWRHFYVERSLSRHGIDVEISTEEARKR